MIHPPGAIEELADFHPRFGIGAAQRSGGNIQEQAAQPYGIIQSHFDGIVETDGPIDIERFGHGTPGFFGLARWDSEAAIKTRHKGWQEIIALLRGGGLRQSQFRSQTVLEDAKETFDAPLGLRGEGKNRLDP